MALVVEHVLVTPISNLPGAVLNTMPYGVASVNSYLPESSMSPASASLVVSFITPFPSIQGKP